MKDTRYKFGIMVFMNEIFVIESSCFNSYNSRLCSQMCIHNLMIFMSYSAFFFCLLSVNKQVFKLPQVLSVDRFEGIKGDLELTN